MDTLDDLYEANLKDCGFTGLHMGLSCRARFADEQRRLAPAQDGYHDSKKAARSRCALIRFNN